MTKSESAKLYPILGIIFILAGAMALILAYLNYIEDGKISLTSVCGFIMLLLGVFWYFHGKKLKAQDK